MNRLHRLGVTAIALAIGAAPAAAQTVPTCASLPNPIYLQVGDTQLNLMKALGRKLRDNTAKPITLVFTTSGSCTNISTMYTGAPLITANMQYIPSIAENPTWVQSSPTLACSVPMAGLLPDIGNSALFNSACTMNAPPANLQLTHGPTQAYVLAIPKASTAVAISFEQAYFVFGFGPTLLAMMQGAIPPWTDQAALWIRGPTKSTLLAWAANLTISPVNKFQGNIPGGVAGGSGDTSPAVQAAVQNSTDPDATIGLLGAEVYDASRATLSVLAYRARGQYAAYYPDSTSTARDKQNIRDGHYTVWSPTIWMNFIDGNGNPTNPDAQYVVDMIAGKDVTPAPNFEPDVQVANVGLVPDCAMRVTRSFEGGPLALYTPPESCTCKYLATVASTSCDTCTTTCATGTCRNGYCEDF